MSQPRTFSTVLFGDMLQWFEMEAAKPDRNGKKRLASDILRDAIRCYKMQQEAEAPDDETRAAIERISKGI